MGACHILGCDIYVSLVDSVVGCARRSPCTWTRFRSGSDDERRARCLLPTTLILFCHHDPLATRSPRDGRPCHRSSSAWSPWPSTRSPQIPFLASKRGSG